MNRLHLALLASLLGGCALTSRGESLDPHYFSPELEPAPQGFAARPSLGPLRLGRVRAATGLKEKIVFRDSVYEVGYYEERRWTERPDVYVRRALARALFEGAGFVQAASSSAPTLDVDIFAFEEIRGAQPVVRIGLTMVVRDDDTALVEKTLVVDEPLSTTVGDGPATPLVRAFSRALSRIVATAVAETKVATAAAGK
jgi:cholesterol transport system auxiliary component